MYQRKPPAVLEQKTSESSDYSMYNHRVLKWDFLWDDEKQQKNMAHPSTCQSVQRNRQVRLPVLKSWCIIRTPTTTVATNNDLFHYRHLKSIFELFKALWCTLARLLPRPASQEGWWKIKLSKGNKMMNEKKKMNEASQENSMKKENYVAFIGAKKFFWFQNPGVIR